MANRYDLSPLFDARRGLPTERKAVDTIAVFAAIPAVIVGILAGALFVKPADSAGWLATVVIGTAVAAAAAAVGGVLAVYKVLGFRPLIRLADGMVGGYVGVFAGSALSSLTGGWWPLLLGPVAALVGLLLPLPERP